MFFKRKIIAIILFLLVVTGCTKQSESQESIQQLTISAAASLQEALTEIKTLYEKKNEGVEILYNFGGSGSLKQQIEQGAPVDLFFSASKDKYDELLEKGYIIKGINLIGNEIVLIKPKDLDFNLEQFEDLTQSNIKKIAIGTPESVPAGKYAKETLQSHQIWEDVQDKMVFAKDVRQVLMYVETKSVEAGVVYKTDALLSDKVEVVATASGTNHSPIIYPIGIINGSKFEEEANRFYEFLQKEESLEVFEKLGFHTISSQ